MSQKQLFLILLSVIVSSASVAFILSEAPLADVIVSIEKADRGQLALAFLLTTLSLVTRGLRWRGLLGNRVSASKACHFVNVMFLGNQLPLRLGEVARSILAARDGVPIATAAASIVVERLMDTLLVVLLLAATVSQLPDAPQHVTDAAAFFGLAALAGFVLLLIFARRPAYARAIVATLMRFFPQLRRLPLMSLTDNLLGGLSGLADARALFSATIWTCIAWATSLATFYCLHLALDIDVNAALSVPLGVSLAALGIALPVSVAALGPFEGAILISGGLVGMDSLTAISLGFLYHGFTIFCFAIWGSFSLLALGISPRKAFTAREPSSEEPS